MLKLVIQRCSIFVFHPQGFKILTPPMTPLKNKGRAIFDSALIILWFRILFFENEDNFQSHPIFNDLCVLH
jgi:hypothetical protein